VVDRLKTAKRRITQTTPYYNTDSSVLLPKLSAKFYLVGVAPPRGRQIEVG